MHEFYFYQLQIIYHFRLFPKSIPHAEKIFRFNIGLFNYRTNVNITIPFIIHAGYFIKGYQFFFKPKKIPQQRAYTIEHIYEYRFRKFLRTGFDAFTGEFALLLSFLKIWFICEYFGNSFQQNGRLTLFNLLLKICIYEITFRINLFGFGFSFHIPFYNIPILKRYRRQQARLFFKGYRDCEKQAKSGTTYPQ